MQLKLHPELDMDTAMNMHMTLKKKIAKDVGSSIQASSYYSSGSVHYAGGGGGGGRHVDSSASLGPGGYPNERYGCPKQCGCEDMGHIRTMCPNRSKWTASDCERFELAEENKSRRGEPGSALSLACMVYSDDDEQYYPGHFALNTASNTSLVRSREHLHDYVPLPSPIKCETGGGMMIDMLFGTVIIDVFKNGRKTRIMIDDVALTPSVRTDILSVAMLNESGLAYLTSAEYAELRTCLKI
jgi:hypothetical protein